MKYPEIPSNDKERLEALHSYSILDTLEEEEYNAITTLASQICNTKISVVSFVDKNRQWFKAKKGLEATETPRDLSFCAHSLNTPREIFEIKDAKKDERFKDNPLVIGGPNITFYAGMPLVDSEGMSLGSLCVIDDKPSELTNDMRNSLRLLSTQVVKLLELRKKDNQNCKLIRELELNNKALSEFASRAAHDLKSPLNSIIPVADVLNTYYSENIDDDGKKLLNIIKDSAQQLDNLIDGILEYSQNIHSISINKENVNFYNIIFDIVDVFKQKAIFKVDINPEFEMFTNKVAVKQILLNLISNAIKYNDKDKPIVNIKVFTKKSKSVMIVEDNGMGIPDEEIDTIFKIFQKTSNKPQDGSKSTGIGLATVSSLVDNLDGKINIKSKIGIGTKIKIIF